MGYRDGILKRLTEDYKYKAIRKTAEVLAELLDTAIPKELKNVAVVPLPTISRHIRERGFDHTLLLAKRLAERRGWMVETVLLRKNKSVQVGASEEKRKEQARRAYEVAQELDEAKCYLLLDDVWTTGASMESAIEAVKKAGAKKVASAVVLIPIGD